MPAASSTTRRRIAGRPRARGLTLIELTVVVLIVAILAAIAVTSYLSYATRGKVRTAEGDLVALSLNLDNYLQRQLAYPARKTTTTDATKDAFKGWVPAEGADFVYTMDAYTTGYKLTATGIGGRLSTCTLSIDDLGQRAVGGNCGSITSW